LLVSFPLIWLLNLFQLAATEENVSDLSKKSPQKSYCFNILTSLSFLCVLLFLISLRFFIFYFLCCGEEFIMSPCVFMHRHYFGGKKVCFVLYLLSFAGKFIYISIRLYLLCKWMAKRAAACHAGGPGLIPSPSQTYV
jgi:hypothetical protein